MTGDPGRVDDALTCSTCPEGAEVLGPVPVDDEQRRVRGAGAVGRRAPRCRKALGELQRVRSARKLRPGVGIQVDPPHLRLRLTTRARLGAPTGRLRSWTP